MSADPERPAESGAAGTMPEATKAAIEFLREHISIEQHALLLGDIKRAGLDSWTAHNRFPFGSTVRSALRSAGFNEQVMGVGSLDEIWGELVFRAVQEG
jgi:hypothetical protein